MEKTLMTIINKRYLMIMLSLIMMVLTHNAKALIVPEDCETSDATAFFALTAFEVESYIPSCLLYTSPSPRDATLSRMPSSA